jgi:hypothetical protein
MIVAVGLGEGAATPDPRQMAKTALALALRDIEIAFGQFVTVLAVRYQGATGIVGAPLGDHILSVIAGRPDPQVSGVHAWWIVASVADVQALRNGLAVHELAHQPRGDTATPVDV